MILFLIATVSHSTVTSSRNCYCNTYTMQNCFIWI